jgi:uncharacterized protein with von Willebrand factor type A (vWA) domain
LTVITPSELPPLLLDIARTLRKNGERVGIGEIVEAERILRDYMLLQRQKFLTIDELVLLLSYIWPPASRKKRLIKEEIEKKLSSKKVEERASKIYGELLESAAVLGVKPGHRVSLKNAVKQRKRERRQVKASYYKLKRVGAIKGRSGSERLADETVLKSIALKLAKAGFSTIDDAINSMRAPKRRDDILLQLDSRIPFTREQLEGLSESRLLKTGWDAVRKHDRRTQNLVAEILKTRISRGEPLRDPQDVVEFLKKTHNLSSNILLSIIAQGEPVEGVSPETIAKVLSTMDNESGGILLAKYRKYMSSEEYLKLLSLTDPKKLWQLSDRNLGGEFSQLIKAVSNAARAYREAVEYARTLDPGRADMSSYYASRAEQFLENLNGTGIGNLTRDAASTILAEARNIIKAVEGIGRGVAAEQLAKAISKLELGDAVLVLKGLYSRAESEEVRRLVVSSMERLLSRVTSKHGLALTSRWRINTVSGRLELRRTLYNIVRNRPDTLVFREKARSRAIGLGLDVSSSMISYSSWALAVASMFSRHVEKIAFFSHTVEVYQGPFTRRDMARLLLEASFGGRTNISQALRVLGEHLQGKRLIIVSDLSQTVEDDPPWKIVAELRRRGIKTVFITHERHDREARALIEEERGKVVVAKNPKEAARKILSIIR